MSAANDDDVIKCATKLGGLRDGSVFVHLFNFKMALAFEKLQHDTLADSDGDDGA
jgi:hypothetical protein